MNRRISTIAGALAVTLPLAGCGVFSGGSGDHDSDTLTYWSMWEQGEPQSEVLQSAIDDFEEAEGVTVEVQWAGREVSKKIRAGSNTGTVPDLTDDAVEVLLSGSDAGLYSGLGDVYSEQIPGEDATIADVVPAKYLGPYKNDDGEPIVVPYEVLTTSVWYDGNRFPEIAENPPETWDDFVAAMEEMKDDGLSPIAADGTIPDYNAYWIYQLVERELGPGWLNKAAADKTGEAWSDPGFLRSAQRVEEIVQNDYFMEGYQGSKLPAAQQAWAQGEASFLLMGSWAPADAAEVASPDTEFRSFPMPMVPGGVRTQELNLIGFGIPDGAENPELAAKFAAFFMQRDQIGKIASEANNLTSRTDVPAPDDLADLQPMLENASTGNRYLDGVPTDSAQFWSGVFLPLSDKLFFGEITAEEFVSQLEADSKSFWQNNG